MTISFETENDAVVFALEKIIQFARINQYLFFANCVWWIAGVIGLESGLVLHIDNLETLRLAEQPRETSTTPIRPAEESCLDRILESAERAIQESTPVRNILRPGRVDPRPKSKRQLKKVRKLKRLQETGKKPR
jgi:hypothetical protein